MAPYHL